MPKKENDNLIRFLKIKSQQKPFRVAALPTFTDGLCFFDRIRQKDGYIEKYVVPISQMEYAVETEKAEEQAPE